MRAHCAVVVFGKAMTSLMELAPANNITNLSSPYAIPPALDTKSPWNRGANDLVNLRKLLQNHTSIKWQAGEDTKSNNVCTVKTRGGRLKQGGK